MSRIEQTIDDIEAYIEECKPYPLSSSKIIVNKEELGELLMELRSQIPDEIKKYQKIISNQDAIIDQAKKQADGLVQEANKKTAELIEEHEIMQKAYANANRVIEEANNQGQIIINDAAIDAANMKHSIMKYSDDMLASIQYLLERLLDETKGKFESFESSLENYYGVVSENRNELNAANQENTEE